MMIMDKSNSFKLFQKYAASSAANKLFSCNKRVDTTTLRFIAVSSKAKILDFNFLFHII